MGAATFGRLRRELPRADILDMVSDVLRGGIESGLDTAGIFLQFQAAGCGFLDVPVEAPGDFTQPEGIASGQRVDRQLQAAAFSQVTGADGRAPGLVVDDTQAAIGAFVYPVDIAVQPHRANLGLQGKGGVPHTKARLEMARRVSLRDFGQGGDGAPQFRQQVFLLQFPQRRGAEAVFGGRGSEDLGGDFGHQGQAFVYVGGVAGAAIGEFENLVQHRAEYPHIVAVFGRGARLQLESVGDIEIERAGSVGFEFAGTPAII